MGESDLFYSKVKELWQEDNEVGGGGGVEGGGEGVEV